MTAIYVQIVETRGSTPRNVGTAMKVTADGTTGTIGGGTLEFQAIAHARELFALGLPRDVTRSFALGPNLGQCCGGAVTLRFTASPCQLDPTWIVGEPVVAHVAPKALWLWGAGHVGRAIVDAVPLGAFDLTWADTERSRFPKAIPHHVTAIPATDLPRLASRGPTHAHHLIFTYSHDIDFALCVVLLKRGAASIGLIGSDTKRARFFKRLRALDLDPAPIDCPIGDKSLGKRPDQIARGVVQSLLLEVAA